MVFSEYENIEIFSNTQNFDINKCENQTLRLIGAIKKYYYVSDTCFKLTHKLIFALHLISPNACHSERRRIS
jgi:hypothetical protein